MRRRWSATLMGGLLLLACLAPAPTAEVGPWNDIRNLGPVGAVIAFILWDWRRGQKDREKVEDAMNLVKEALDQRDQAKAQATVLVELVRNNTAAVQGLTDMLRQIPRFCPWNEPGGPMRPVPDRG